MSRPKTGKGGNLAKLEPKSKVPVLREDKLASRDELLKGIFPIRFRKGKDKNTVERLWDFDSEVVNALIKTFATNNPDVWEFYSIQLAGCADSRNEAAKNLNQLVPILHDIAPKDALETLLAVQMVGIHNVAMKCLGRAMLPQQTFEGRQTNLNYATRLLKTFTDQMDALQKHRGKSTQQKVTVEHVHVHLGGQAIVGAANHRDKGGVGGDDGQS